MNLDDSASNYLDVQTISTTASRNFTDFAFHPRNGKLYGIDNGSGIPQDILENIFVPFFTSKATGSGIGLSLCKQIMLLHKGRIIVKSVEGEGSVFSLVF